MSVTSQLRLLLAAGATGAAGLLLLERAAATWLATPPTRLAPSASPTATAPLLPPPAPTLDDAPAVASYRLDVQLDADRRTLRGEAVIRWRNTARLAVEELWFHLYLEAFAHPRTLLLRDPWRRHRGGLPPVPGGLELSSLTADELGELDLWPGRDRHSPGDPDDGTDVRVPLPRPIAPGEHLTLRAPFVARLPSLVERTGFAEDFVFAGQWFPKLARLEPDGTWAHFAFHPQAEFYADFGDYDATLTLPATMVVGATGEQLEASVDGAQRRLRFRARGVHDFAWTAWDGFRERRTQVGATAVRILYPKGQGANASRSLLAIHAAMPRLSAWYGPYPHPTLTVVHPPRFAAAAGGMEYPTLITTGGSFASSLGTRAIETLTVHELAHQWFQGLIASNEQRWPLLDEGLASYAEARLLREMYGDSAAVALPGLSLSADALRRAHAASHAHDEVAAQPAAAFAGFASIAGLAYAKTAVTLDTLARSYGEEQLARALSRYAREQRFRHPTWNDWVEAVRQEVGVEAARSLVTALAERGWINFVAERPSCEPPVSVAGEDGTARATTTTRCRALVRRHGTIPLPVVIELRFADGTRERLPWEGPEPWLAVEREGPAALVAVRVDPDRRVPLDTNRLDDAATTAPRSAWYSLERLTYWAALGLGWLGP